MTTSIYHDTTSIRKGKAMARCYRLDGDLAGRYVVRLYWFPNRLDLFDERGSQPYMRGEWLHEFPTDAKAIRFTIGTLDDFAISKEHELCAEEINDAQPTI